jgi:hypothetical protein
MQSIPTLQNLDDWVYLAREILSEKIGKHRPEVKVSNLSVREQ